MTNLSSPPAPAGVTPADGAQVGPVRACAVFGAVAVVLGLVSALSAIHLPLTVPPPAYHPGVPSWLQGWVRWDAGWYLDIATEGYTYLGPHVQSAVAFFPAYPALMRLGGLVVDPLVAGIAVTLACGLAAVVCFRRWCADVLGERSARVAVACLVLYPFSYYLFGAVYADALFLLAAVGAFLLLERGSPWLAGLAGAVATASRPVGAAVVVGLVIRALELRRRAEPESRPTWLASSGVLVSALGVAAYCALLWYRFDSPTAFLLVADAPGWERNLDLSTVLHYRVLYLALHPALDVEHLRVGLQTLATVGSLALVPLVVRRFGWGYGAYCIAVVGVPAVAALDFVGMGRYILAAFPCFAVAGDLLASAGRRVRAAVLAGNGLLLVLMTSLFARGHYLS